MEVRVEKRVARCSTERSEMRRAMTTMVNNTHRLEVDKTSRTLSLIPTAGHSATMLMLHGLGNNAATVADSCELYPPGDTAGGWADAAAHFSGSLPQVKFILPTAPTQPVRCPALHLCQQRSRH